MKNIHLIQTDKKSRLLLEIDTKKIFIVSTYFQDHYRKHQNIYITSDEEIISFDEINSLSFQDGKDIQTNMSNI